MGLGHWLRRAVFLGAVAAFSAPFLTACTKPPELKKQDPIYPKASIELLLTIEIQASRLGENVTSRPLAELRGAQLFFQDLNHAGALKGLLFNYRRSGSERAKDSMRKDRVESKGGGTLKNRGRTPPAPIAGRPTAKTREKAASARKKASTIVGVYVGDHPADRAAFSAQSTRLPTVTCGAAVPGKGMFTLSGLTRGAARKALALLRSEGEREFFLVSDFTAYGRRGRREIGRIAETLGMKVHPLLSSSGSAEGLLKRVSGTRSRPLLAWLGREGAEGLIRAARRSGHPGKILLGPAAVHPLLASPPERAWTDAQLQPPRAERGEAILAVGHKLAVAGVLDHRDPLKRRLERFRDLYRLAHESTRPPPLPAACAYDALLFMMESVFREVNPKAIAGMGPSALRRMRERRTFAGTLGTHRFIGGTDAPYHEAALGADSFILVRAHNGRWTPVKGPGKRLTGFKGRATPTRALPPRLQNRAEPSRRKATVPLVIRR